VRSISGSILLAATLLLPCALARPQSYGPPLGSLGLSFDPGVLQRRIEVAAMENFDWYVTVAIDFGSALQNGRDGLLIWEASLAVPPEITILSAEHVPDVAFCDECSATDWRALLGRCVFADETPTVMVHYQAKLLQDVDDLTISLVPASPSNFGDTAPGWRVCANTGDALVDLHPFATGWTNPIHVNSTVANERSSWSALRGRY